MDAFLVFATLILFRIVLPVTLLLALGTWVERRARAAQQRLMA